MSFITGLLLGTALGYVYGKVRGQSKADAKESERYLEDEALLETAAPDDYSVLLRFSYRDIGGGITKRTVRVMGFEGGAHAGAIWGYCELRGSMRTFRLDRMFDCINVQTSRTLRNPSMYFAALYGGKEARIGHNFPEPTVYGEVGFDSGDGG